MKIVDVNILLYVVNPDADQHSQVLRWWKTAIASGEPLGFAWMAVLGFVRISTNPKVFPQHLTVEEALSHVEDWLKLPNARIVQEASDHWLVFRELIATVGSGGNLTGDAHLAALAIGHGATIVSCDTDFLKFRQVRFENPMAG